MAQDARSPRLAVLIDADNVSAKVADGLFAEIAKFGDASVRRIYGDFSGQRSKEWASVLARHAIVPQQQFAYTTGKNASDITLVIDAMDLLHSGRFDGFCLVSSDSDFTRLASRIREQGLDVYGFGEQKTPEAFRQACHRFIFTENLLPGAIAAAQDSQAPSAVPAGGRVLEPLANAEALLRQVVSEMEGDDGWVALGGLGSRLNAVQPDFDSRTYGFAKLSGLVEKSGIFDIERSEGRGIIVKLKPKPKTRQQPRKG